MPTVVSTRVVRVQAGLEEVVVEAHAEGLQVEILLVAQVGDGELADRVEVVRVARGGELAVVGLDRLPGEEVGGDVGDVVAVVELLALRIGRIGRPAVVARLEALDAQLRAVRQRADLHARVVVVELALHRPALAGEQVADGRRRARPGWRGRRAAARSGWPTRTRRSPCCRWPAGCRSASPPASTSATTACLAAGARRRLMKPGPAISSADTQRCTAGCALQRGDELFGDGARRQAQRLGQLHRHGDGQVAMGGLLGGFERGRERGVRRDLGDRGRQGLRQLGFGLDHAGDSTVRGSLRSRRQSGSAATEQPEKRAISRPIGSPLSGLNIDPDTWRPAGRTRPRQQNPPR